MSFLSPTFFLFFPLVSLVYFCLPARLKAPWLLLASIYFCFSAGPDSLFFLLCALAVTYGGGRALEGLSGRRRKLLLAGLLFLLFGTLFVFKYLAFALSLLARLFQAAAQALPYQPEYVYDRHSVRKAREKREIGISAVRGGNIVGDHEVIFAGENEVIELRHSAMSREVFASGAIRAARFLAGVEAPGLYSMADLVGERQQ